jgi:hypothetical protein
VAPQPVEPHDRSARLDEVDKSGLIAILVPAQIEGAWLRLDDVGRQIEHFFLQLNIGNIGTILEYGVGD